MYNKCENCKHQVDKQMEIQGCLSLREMYGKYAEWFAILLIASFLLGFNTSGVKGTGNETDHLALLDFKSRIIHDPQNIFKSWNDSFHFCNWDGVQCGPRHRRVIVLDLSSKELQGSLSPFVGNLSFLREIRLQNNTLQGEIPPQLGHLFRLQLLHLGNNSLEGTIPSNLSHCSNLIHLHLSFNKLIGKIPPELGSLSKLERLYIYRDYLSGGIPPSLGNLTSLEILFTSENAFGGTIPASLGQLQNLSILGLGGNNLSGIVPPAIFNISSITSLSLYDNKLSGTVPSNIGLMLPKLQILRAWGNQFSGSLPVSLSNASNLEELDLGMNSLVGKVNVYFGDMQQLAYLNLDENILGTLEGNDLDFLASLANCSNLVMLQISNNRLRGMLPGSVANLSSGLDWLAIEGNQIYGDIPSGLSNLVGLTRLFMQGNQFTGHIPTEIGKLQNLVRFSLSHNRFSGQIPSSIGNLSLLTEIYLEHNALHGTIPSSLGNCSNLQIISISQNNLSGLIPKKLFSIPDLSVSLDLSKNHLVGTLPLEIGHLFNLNELVVSRNKLSGNIPNELGQCKSLVSLFMDNNNFRGTIPPSLHSLKGLKFFDLSHNNLSGRIPEYLGEFALAYLNLSYNNFEGKVPTKGVFANVSAISVEGNNRICGGISKLNLPRCKREVPREHRGRKPGVAKIMAPISAVMFFLVTFMLAILYCKVRKQRKGRSSDQSFRMGSMRKISYETILKATDGFSSTNLVGVGSYASVYKGTLDQEDEAAIVAIKVLNLQQQGASKSFMAECKALKNIRHRNLLKVITSCSSIDFQGNDFKAIVFEFMHNGSLDKWLHQDLERGNLSLLQRIDIAIDVANGLDYLHNQCQDPVVHCDLKPSNVLLDLDMTAHVGDFGLSKFKTTQLTNQNQSSSSSGGRGTIGYTPPEYGLGSEVSANGDVYSYGILVLEMVTRKRPVDNIFGEGLNLHNFAKMAITNPDQVAKIVDPSILLDDDHKMVTCLLSLVKIGVACSMDSPEDRMKIPNVINELQEVRNFLQGGKKYTKML